MKPGVVPAYGDHVRSQIAVKNSKLRRVLCQYKALLARTKRAFSPLAFGDVVNRSNQMGTRTFVVIYGRDADFAGQPPSGVIAKAFLFVNNRLEGNAPATIVSIVDT